MTTLSLIVSVISLGLAAVMAAIVVRLRREERERFAARVAALGSMAATDFLSETDVVPAMPAVADAGTSGPNALLSVAEPASTTVVRLAVAGLIVAALAVAGSIAAFRTHTAATESASTAAPLELVALTHQENGGVLTVTGRVRNPRGAEPIASPTATVFLFGSDGAFLTSGRALLGTPTLTAGATADFAVAIPVTGQVARYRVSFRDSANQPVAHLDKRSGAPVARNE